mmetsp:Transcript_142874/g.252254  ORF Transcript_142874/g.252254 Transcript_142874/m.252254 type:complete len:413 (-) Transcript_142874:17-1255(-)
MNSAGKLLYFSFMAILAVMTCLLCTGEARRIQSANQRSGDNSDEAYERYAKALLSLPTDLTAAFHSSSPPVGNPQRAASRQNPFLRMAAAEAVDTGKRSFTPLPRQHETWSWRGHTIRHRIEGPADGQPVLFIHGFGASVSHFRDNIPALADAGYRVHAIDLLGFGGSDKPALAEEPFDGPVRGDGYCMELWGNQTVDYVRAFSAPGESWVLAGNSIGGLTSMMAANALGPAAVRAVCLLNTAGGMNVNRYSDLPWLLRPFIWVFRNVLLDPKGNGPSYFENFRTEENVRSVFKQVYPRFPERADDALIESILWPAEDPNAADVFLKIFRGPAGPTPESQLTLLQVPVLGLWGDSDPWTPMDKGRSPNAEQFGKYCKSWRLQPLPGIGHCPHDEAPELVNEALLSWLAELEA